jgi:hypothetical protein
MCQTSYVAAGTFLPGRHLLFFLLQSPLLLLERHTLQRGLRCSTLAPPPGEEEQQAPAAAPAAATARLREVTNNARLQQPHRIYRRRLRLTSSWWLVQRSVLTYAVLFCLAERLFWPPLEACKSDVNGVAEIADGLAWVRRLLQVCLVRWQYIRNMYIYTYTRNIYTYTYIYTYGTYTEQGSVHVLSSTY